MSSEGSDALAKTATAEATPTVGDPDVSKAASTGRHVGRYRLEDELGAGGMGVVHAAFDPELERRVAIKLLLRIGSTESRQRFLREARALAKLTHPNVVHVYEVGTHEGRDFIAMELVEGSSVADWLRSKWRSMREIIAVFVAAGRGLAAAHAAGIVHRDFKPHNILRGNDGRVLVTDFGLACAAEQAGDVVDVASESPLLTTLTATGSWVGTPAYMAPEQWNGGTVGPATDQFAFCVALWEALTDERPFQGENAKELQAATMRGLTKAQIRKVPTRYRAALVRGLHPEPAKRWPNMEALLKELDQRSRQSMRVLVLCMIVFGGGPLLWGFLYGHDKAKEDDHLDRHPDAAEVTRGGGGEVEVPRNLMRELVGELQLGKQPRFIPTFANGKAVGFKAEAIPRKSLVFEIGLLNGDVITALDGESLLSSSDDFARVIGKPRTPDQALRVDLVRDGQPHTIHVRVRPTPK